MADETLPVVENTITNRALRIEMVLAQLYVGGMEMMVVHLMRELRRRGHEVGLTCIEREGSLYNTVKEDGFRVRLVPVPGPRNLLSPRSLTHWLKHERPDVVHIHSGAWIKAAVAARRAGVPRVIYTHHGLEEREGFIDGVLNRYAARFTDRVVAVSDELRDRMQTEGGLKTHTIAVLPNGVPTDLFTPDGPVAGLRRRFEIPETSPIVGNVARMWPIKNQLGLIDAFALLREQHPTTCLILVGDGATRPQIEQRIAEHNLGDSVFLAGEMRGLEAVYREFDLFALSSFSEGMSISILEAMATGKCVVATSVGGNPALLGNGRFGMLVPDMEPQTFAKAMSQALSDDGLRTRLATAARAHVLESFSVGAMGDVYERLYHAGANGRGPVPSINREDPACVG